MCSKYCTREDDDCQGDVACKKEGLWALKNVLNQTRLETLTVFGCLGVFQALIEKREVVQNIERKDINVVEYTGLSPGV